MNHRKVFKASISCCSVSTDLPFLGIAASYCFENLWPWIQKWRKKRACWGPHVNFPGLYPSVPSPACDFCNASVSCSSCDACAGCVSFCVLPAFSSSNSWHLQWTSDAIRLQSIQESHGSPSLLPSSHSGTSTNSWLWFPLFPESLENDVRLPSWKWQKHRYACSGSVLQQLVPSPKPCEINCQLGAVDPVVHVFIHPAARWLQNVRREKIAGWRSVLSGSKLSRTCVTVSKPLNSEVSCSEIKSSFACHVENLPCSFYKMSPTTWASKPTINIKTHQQHMCN